MDRNDGELLGMESRDTEEGSQCDILSSGGAAINIKQDISSKIFQFGGEFQRFMLNRVHRCQKLAYRLRFLNKSGKERVEKGIKEVKISLINIKSLAKSQLCNHITKLDVFLRGGNIWVLQNLPFMSPVFFPSIKNVNLIITGTFKFDRDLLTDIEITIQEPLIATNLNVINKSDMKGLIVQGKYDVIIQDCTFSGLSINCLYNAQVSMVNSRFVNAQMSGIVCYQCDSLFIDQIMIQDCVFYGCEVFGCGNVSIDNIQLISCAQGGIYFVQVNGFKLRNAFVQDCGWSGIVVYDNCVGEIQSAHVQGCQVYGIEVCKESIVRYAQIQCENNAKGEFNVHDNCQFLQMN